MFRYLSIIVISAWISGCGPSQDAHDAEEAQEQANIQLKLATFKQMEGTYVGTITDDTVTPPTQLQVRLQAKTALVQSAVAASNKIEQIPTILGYLYEVAHEVVDKNGPQLGDVEKCVPAKPTHHQKQVCTYYQDMPERTVASYGMGDYDGGGSLQFWAASPQSSSSTNPIIASAGMQLTVSSDRKHLQGIFYTQFSIQPVTLDRQQ